MTTSKPDISDLPEGLQRLVKKRRFTSIQIKQLKTSILKAGVELSSTDKSRLAAEHANKEYSKVEKEAHNTYLEKENKAKSIRDFTIHPYKHQYDKTEAEARSIKENIISNAIKEYENTIKPLKEKYDNINVSAKRTYENTITEAVNEYNNTTENIKKKLHEPLSDIRKEMKSIGFVAVSA